ncbi:hypothetical protein F8O07_03840 [Pseudoclavibacter sp. CFCC 13796]|uniref:hypothetical protein n=1 Tax=Pseudoclavibacter sp. CFCC 13796 TaxID=2615179 RepID=UPI00130165E8|nr:hypothetical protein [Pseudoclavibacter sp. CFCC 13796]KAB1661097.1 hypothetical protein F8O07_03840 [Pseudoclavibacter sp. CFCC 13796]
MTVSWTQTAPGVPSYVYRENVGTLSDEQPDTWVYTGGTPLLDVRESHDAYPLVTNTDPATAVASGSMTFALPSITTGQSVAVPHLMFAGLGDTRDPQPWTGTQKYITPGFTATVIIRVYRLSEPETSILYVTQQVKPSVIF